MTQFSNSRLFSQLIKECQHMAFGLACRMVQDEDVAKDMMQEALIKAWKHFNRYDQQRKFSTWFCRIVLNTCKDYLKSPMRKIELSQFPENEIQSSEEDRLENSERRKVLLLLKDKLPQRQRDVFVLHDLQGFSQKEVEEILKLKTGSARSHLYYARKNLKEQFQKYLQNEQENERKVHR